MDGARGTFEKNHNGLLFTTSNEYICSNNFRFSCMGKKVPFSETKKAVRMYPLSNITNSIQSSIQLTELHHSTLPP